MLSILIPIYNYNCKPLLESLHAQAEASHLDYEILVADDCSTTCRPDIEDLSKINYIQFFQMEKNIGRSRIRNFLASKAKYKYLLFLDCDAKISNDKFLKRYFSKVKPGICCSGGIALYPYTIGKEYALNLMYNKKVESKYTKKRIFTTFNFVIDKQLFNKVKFDESINNYGHEDTIFATKIKELSKITFIQNPIIHLGLNTNKEYIRKVEMACRNMSLISTILTEKQMHREFRLWRAYSHIRRLGLDNKIATLFKKNQTKLRVKLLTSKPCLTILNLYKLGYLCSIIAEQKS